ncbi:hypothetical protein TRFO_25895 [Tritrichomonas foetus]|uniref:Uncharacterized protein n=1 Tax=Tritrichomonas foetus TaxID=1144522 RepID=A0A1J4K5B9_9EUKA|nr:hypothetical protein TRFO_25895 [Tritrichomonas foetus]|eukprot:OHT06186.1 hypothetical protein TRFO_25895 [Tritrichomonas foetus]
MNRELEELRAVRYADARTLWTGSFWQNEREMKTADTINKESVRIFELEQQYQSAQAATADLIESTEAEISKLEEEAKNASSGISKIEKALDNFKKTQNKQKAVSENELHKDHNTYQTATKLLNERVAQAQIELQSIKETIEGYEPRAYLKNPQAQELYLQLRALLTAQEKELRTFLRSATQTNANASKGDL